MTLATATAGCTTTASRELMLAVKNYETRSLEAIASVEAIEVKAVEQPEVSASRAEQDFATAMLDPSIEFDGMDDDGDPDTPEIDGRQVVENGVHMFDAPANLPVGLALDEMRCAHGYFTTSLSDVEAAGFLGKRPVATQASPILHRLIAQQIVTAQLVSGPLKAEMLGHKAALVAEIQQIRAGSDSEERKREALIAIRARWLAIEAQERQLTEAAVENLLKAAATGILLDDQIEQYGRWSFSELVDSANGLSSFISSVSGRDLTALNGKIEEVRGAIESDPDLKQTVETLLASIEVPSAAGLPALPAVAGAPGGPVVPAAATLGRDVSFDTPCLARNSAAVTGAGE